MKIDKQKLFNAIFYLNEINGLDLRKIDYSDLFDNKTDLTEKEKEDLFWTSERLTNIDAITKYLFKIKN
jgi:hypothetical protein